MEKDKGGVRCGYVYKHLDLRDRQWMCPQCGTTLDRDANAATNIMRQGIASPGSSRKTKAPFARGASHLRISVLQGGEYVNYG